MATLCLDPSNYMRPSTKRQGRHPFKVQIRVRLPLGVPGHINALLRGLFIKRCWASLKTARVLCRCGEMADTLVLGTSAARRAGSSPVIGTKFL